jgi:hypothetical protein
LSVSGLSQLAFLREVASRVASVVPYDAGAWLVTDLATLLQTGGVIQGPQPISEQTHLRFADNELLTPDSAKITEMARGMHPVVTLQEATDGDLSRSARHRTIHADLGIPGVIVLGPDDTVESAPGRRRSGSGRSAAPAGPADR